MISKILRLLKLYDKPLGIKYQRCLLHYKNRIAHKRFLQHAPEALAAAKRAFEKSGTSFWLDFGSLLGCVRDSGVIAHDFDLDLAMRIEDFTPDLQRALFDEGFLVKRYFRVHTQEQQAQESQPQMPETKIVEVALIYKGIARIDIFLRHLNNTYCLKYIDEAHKAQNLYKVRRYSFALAPYFEIRNFLGVKVNIPANADSYLAYLYGADYLVPNEYWKPDLSKDLPFPDSYGEIIGTW